MEVKGQNKFSMLFLLPQERKKSISRSRMQIALMRSILKWAVDGFWCSAFLCTLIYQTVAPLESSLSSFSPCVCCESKHLVNQQFWLKPWRLRWVETFAQPFIPTTLSVVAQVVEKTAEFLFVQVEEIHWKRYRKKILHICTTLVEYICSALKSWAKLRLNSFEHA